MEEGRASRPRSAAPRRQLLRRSGAELLGAALLGRATLEPPQSTPAEASANSTHSRKQPRRKATRSRLGGRRSSAAPQPPKLLKVTDLVARTGVATRSASLQCIAHNRDVPAEPEPMVPPPQEMPPPRQKQRKVCCCRSDKPFIAQRSKASASVYAQTHPKRRRPAAV